MHRIKAYIELLDKGIEELIHEEIAGDMLSSEHECDLYTLFGNRKHAKELLMEKEHMQSMPLGVAESIHTAKNPY